MSSRKYNSAAGKRAARRLAKEYAILLSSPLENCAASPKMNANGDVTDLFEWHVNLTSTNRELEGTHFHFIMKFPECYPDSAPKVEPKSYIDHPNVFGGYICLDILTTSTATVRTPYRGWTNAYTVSSILVQLQSFLFEVCPNVHNVTRMISSASRFYCTCGHQGTKAFPEVECQVIDNFVKPTETPVYTPPTAHKFKNGVNWNELQGEWVNSRLMELKVENKLCYFFVSGASRPTEDPMSYDGTYYYVNYWRIHKDSETLTWTRTNGNGGGTVIWYRKDIAATTIPNLSVGTKLRVVAQFDYDNRQHHTTEDFAHIGDQLVVKKIRKTRTGLVDGLTVQKYPYPWRRGRSRFLPTCHLNKVVIPEKKPPIEVIEPAALIINSEISLEEQAELIKEQVYSWTDERVHEELKNRSIKVQKRFRKTLLEAIMSEQTTAMNATTTESFEDSVSGLYYFDILPMDLFQTLQTFFTWKDLMKICSVSEEFGNSMLTNKKLQMQSYRCFYSLMDATDENTILGYGVQCTRMDKRSRVTNRKKMCLQQLHVSFDIMSYDAYSQCNIRNNIWKDCPVDNFLPLYINAEHGRRAMRLNERHLPELVNNGSALTTETIIETYGKAMNTTVVDMMLSVEDVATGQLQLIDSIKALEGYMALHHTLLAYALEYPQIVDQCEEYVGKFIHDVQSRDKEIVPDIGELLIAMSLTDYCWSEFILAWLEESMTRSARWTLAKFPNLLQQEKKFSCVRLHQTYTATKTGKRLAMFQRFFIERIACPPELEGNPEKNKILFRRYNERCGRPPVGLAEELQQHSRKVLACEDWYTFFNLVGFVAPSSINVWKWLLNAIEISERKDYHQERKILRYSQNHLESPRDTRHCLMANCMCSGRIVKISKKQKGISKLKSGKMWGKSHTVNASTVEVSKPKESERLDVAFCIDTTGSMGRWINAAKQQVRSTMAKLRKSGKQVRFGFVAYKDHYNEGEVTKVSDFTRNEKECQDIVDAWYTKGNTDTAEALATALGKVGDLTWDPRAQRICIVITDAPPHGLGRNVGYGDIYPEGPPDGSDVFKNAHTLGLAGVALYMVYTGRNGLCESVYRGLARRTGGAFLRLTNSSADKLSQIVLTSSLEEDLLDKLAKTVTKYYNQIKARHKIARREQIEYQLHAACVAANVTTSTYWEDEDLDSYHEKQIDDFAECMDLAHARAMVKDGHYVQFPVSHSNKLEEREDVVSKAQIKKILQRVEHQRKMEDIKANRCKFRRSEWSTRAAARRWDEFSVKQSYDVQCVMEYFEPWAKLTSDELSYYAKIPNVTGNKSKSIPLTNEYTRKKKVKYLRVEAEEGVQVRSDPIDTSACIGLLEKTTVITVLQQKGMWIQHQSGWSEWSRGIFSRHSPEYTNLHNKRKQREKIRQQKAAAKEQQHQHEEEKTRLEALVTNKYKVGDRLECVPYSRLQQGTSTWRVCIVTQLQPFTCVFEHNGNEIKRSVYKYLTFRPAPAPVLTESAPHIAPASTGLVSCAVSDSSSSVTGASSDTGSTSTTLSVNYQRDTYAGNQTPYMKPVAVGAQYFVTNQRVVVRADVHPASPIVHELPVDTIITVNCICRERGYIVAPVRGWCWLSSPKGGPLIRVINHIPPQFVPTTTTTTKAAVEPLILATTTTVTPMSAMTAAEKKVTPTIPSVVAPTIVYKRISTQDNNNNMETFQRVVRLLRYYGIQMTQVTVLDNETAEIEVKSHSDGITAIKSIRRINDELVLLTWKPSYLEYRNCSSQV